MLGKQNLCKYATSTNTVRNSKNITQTVRLAKMLSKRGRLTVEYSHLNDMSRSDDFRTQSEKFSIVCAAGIEYACENFPLAARELYNTLDTRQMIFRRAAKTVQKLTLDRR